MSKRCDRLRLLAVVLVAMACRSLAMTGTERYELALAGRRAVLEYHGVDGPTIEAELERLKARIAHWKTLPNLDMETLERLQREVQATREEAFLEAARMRSEDEEAPWTKRARKQVFEHYVDTMKSKKSGNVDTDGPRYWETRSDVEGQDSEQATCPGEENKDDLSRMREDTEEKLKHLTQEEKEELYRTHAGFRKISERLGFNFKGKEDDGECASKRESLRQKISRLRAEAGNGAKKARQYHQETASEKDNSNQKPHGNTQGKTEL